MATSLRIFCRRATSVESRTSTGKNLELGPARYLHFGALADAAQNLLRLFLPFPQASLILHSFRTTVVRFSVAITPVFTQSAHSASVSCIEPAGDCGRLAVTADSRG